MRQGGSQENVLSQRSVKKEVLTEIKMHNVRAVRFRFTGDLLSTIAQDTASQTALRNCSKEVRGEVSMYVKSTFKEKGYMQSSTHLGRRLLLVTRHRYLT